MERQNQRIQVVLKLKAPILTNTSGAINFGLDAAMRRDRQQRPAFPGTLIKGNLRHAWQELHKITGSPTTAFIDKWLGQASSTDKETPEEGLLDFAEFWSDLDWQAERGNGKRYRIAIDKGIGASAAGDMQVLDSPYNTGEAPLFTGFIEAFIDSTKEAELPRWIDKGLSFIPAIGALKTSGFGKVEGVEVTLAKVDDAPRPLDETLANAAVIGLRIKPSRPFCFAKPRVGTGNNFQTENHIPGGAIIAAVARRIHQEPGKWSLLEQYLDLLSFSHAQPVREGSNNRPLQIPLSLIAVGGRFIDITAQGKAEPINGIAPLFSIDWKDKESKAARLILDPSLKEDDDTAPSTCLEIRTAIDPKTGTASESQLFSMEEVIPDGFDWLCNLSLGRIKDGDRKGLVEELHKLFQRTLTHLGKTKARAIVTMEPGYPYTLGEQQITGEVVSIYLQSPARLLPTGFQSQGTNRGDRLHAAYADAWQELSGESLSLNHFYAQQQLLGGRHWWKRFAPAEQNYHPELFTTAGSVFVLKIENGKRERAMTFLERWRRDGLPQLMDAPGGERWQNNPWIAANGYGEIAIDLKTPQTDREGTAND